MKLAESRISLDNAKNAMNMGLFNKALDNQENAQKRNLEFLIAQNHDAATMTDSQTQNMFGLAGHVVAGQYGYAGQQLSAQTQRDIWGQRAQGGLERAQIMANAKMHPNYQAMLATTAKTMPPGSSQQDIENATMQRMMQANMLNTMGGGVIQNIPGAGGGKVLN
jgi:hypothetical protein